MKRRDVTMPGEEKEMERIGKRNRASLRQGLLIFAGRLISTRWFPIEISSRANRNAGLLHSNPLSPVFEVFAPVSRLNERRLPRSVERTKILCAPV